MVFLLGRPAFRGELLVLGKGLYTCLASGISINLHLPRLHPKRKTTPNLYPRGFWLGDMGRNRGIHCLLKPEWIYKKLPLPVGS